MSYGCLMNKFYKSIYTPVCFSACVTLLGTVPTLRLCFPWVLFFNDRGHLNEYWHCYSEVHLLPIDFSVLWAKQHLFSYQLSYLYNVTPFRSPFLECISPPFFVVVGFFCLLFLKNQRIHSTKKMEYSISCHSYSF